MGARTDLLAIVFTAPEKAAAPKGFHFGQMQEVAAAQLQDADRSLKVIEDLITAGARKDAITAVRTAIA